MPQNAPMWMTLLASGIAIGASFVGMLVVRRNLEPVAALLGFLGMAGVVYSFNAISIGYDRVDALMYALGFTIASTLGGYALAASVLDRLIPKETPPRLPQTRAGTGRKAVIVLGCAEPEVYDPRATALSLAKLQAEDLLDVSFSVMPFIFAATKARYRALGGRNRTFEDLHAAAEELERILPSGTADAVAAATCESSPSLSQVFITMLGRGFTDFTVVELDVAEPLAMAAAKRAVDAMHPAESGVTVRYTAPLWESQRVSSLVVRRVMDLVSRPAETGVILLGHGQPETRSRVDPHYDEHETVFLNRVRQLLAEKGVPEENVRVAWTEWREPDVTGALRHLAALGCRRVVVAPACYPLETLATRLDIPTAIRQARVETSVVTVTVPAWNNDPAVIEELRAATLAAVERSED